MNKSAEQCIQSIKNEIQKAGDAAVSKATISFAPGRVNLIGEHIDYSGGPVMPCAIDTGTYVGFYFNDSDYIRLSTLNFNSRPFSYDVKRIPEVIYGNAMPTLRNGWFNYAVAMIKTLYDKGYHCDKGFDIIVKGNMPPSSGLSSSASLEMAVCTAVNDAFDFKINAVDAALYAQEAENKYMHVNCGIMDQFAVACGKKDHTILLDTENLNYEYIPFKLEDYALVGINSKRRRNLGKSAYNERTRECAEALKIIRKNHPQINQLADLYDFGEAKLNRLFQNEDNINYLKRARHAASETKRVIDSALALKSGDLLRFAANLTASHMSLKNDYQVSIKELDFLVESALADFNCRGARLTGAGFGGCTINLLKKEGIDSFIECVGQKFKERFKKDCEFFTVLPSDGAHRIE